MERFKLPEPLPGAVIQPGLFKGTYGGHGIEILSLTYSEDKKTAWATKVTVRLMKYFLGNYLLGGGILPHNFRITFDFPTLG